MQHSSSKPGTVWQVNEHSTGEWSEPMMNLQGVVREGGEPALTIEQNDEKRLPVITNAIPARRTPKLLAFFQITESLTLGYFF